MDVEKSLKQLLSKVTEIEKEIKGLKTQNTHKISSHEDIITYLEKALGNHDRNKMLNFIVIEGIIIILLAGFMIFSLYQLAVW